MGKLQLKRSNVLENGHAKEPTPPLMEFGELAVNYNADDPVIFIKDSQGKIIRLVAPGQDGAKGDKGDAGLDGRKGEAGVKGQKGKSGVKGEKGEHGLKGEKGRAGFQGIKGDEGAAGVKGEKGSKGTKGLKGAFGEKGNQGRAGSKGDKGAKGAVTIVGEIIGVLPDAGPPTDPCTQGGSVIIDSNGEAWLCLDGTWNNIGTIVGPEGKTGTKGAKGEVGPKGQKGELGLSGGKGEAGGKGEHGDTGLKGNQGLKGEKGTKGTIGATGHKGEKGVEGDKGNKGAVGRAGLNGSKGNKGEEGDKGSKGIAGFGIKGEKGIRGEKGFKGAVGPQGIKGAKGNKGIDGIIGSIDGVIKGEGPPQSSDCTVDGQIIVDENGNAWRCDGAGSWDFLGEISGAPGPEGLKGVPGKKGERGLQGLNGLEGPKGDDGQPGAKGEQGPGGGKGEKGQKGQLGEGDKGRPGPPGTAGSKGNKGILGVKGEAGPKGAKGERSQVVGPEGQKGNHGADGVKGDKGFKGEKGYEGDKGNKGIEGIQGDKGNKGNKGREFLFSDFEPDQLERIKGSKGNKGNQGIKGEKPSLNSLFTYMGDVCGPQTLDPNYGGTAGDTYKDRCTPNGPPYNFYTWTESEGWVDITDIFNTEIGPKGEKGNKGAKMTTDELTPEELAQIKGEPGDSGAQGEKGEKGDKFEYDDFTPGQLLALKGEKGIKGEEGITGPKGEKGFKGLLGEKGEQGEKGLPFEYDDFTPEQIKGLTGQKGELGQEGVKGEKGAKGLKGEGLDWNTLPDGDKDALKGPAGEKGNKGYKGRKGERGEKGREFRYEDFTASQLQSIKGEKGTRGRDGDGAGASVEVGPLPPKGASEGDLWWDDESGILYVWYIDDDSDQWVQASPPQVGPKGNRGPSGGEKGEKGIDGRAAEMYEAATPDPDAVPGDFWFNTEYGQLYVLLNSGVWTMANAAAIGSKGEKGEGIDYNSLTPEQQSNLKGNKGARGDEGDSVKGPKGAPGESIIGAPGIDGPPGPPGNGDGTIRINEENQDVFSWIPYLYTKNSDSATCKSNTYLTFKPNEGILSARRFIYKDGSAGFGAQGGIALAGGNTDPIGAAGDSPSEISFYYGNGGYKIRCAGGGPFRPNNDSGTLDLGNATYKWRNVYATNGSIQRADRREASDIRPCTLGTDFIKSLQPVAYKNAKSDIRPKWQTDEQGAFSLDSAGQRVRVADEDGNTVFVSQPGVRSHYGFIAQDIKEALDSNGLTSNDFGGWILENLDDYGERTADPDPQQSLRYHEFIAPLTKALQESIARIEDLESEVQQLKVKIEELEGN